MKCPRCQQENPPQAKFCLECGASLKAPHESGPRTTSSADLQRALSESLEQQAAMSEILRVISSSPTDVQPVFETIAASAARLCDAVDGTMFRVDGDKLVLVAHEGPIPSFPVGPFSPLTPGRPTARAVLEARTIHVVDLQAEVDEYPEGSALARRYDFRTVLSVPLIRAGIAIGAIAIRRTEARPFTERQTELLKTFADQAVIAIENVRLFNETKEALEQQTATSEILRAISSSPADVEPVFEAIVENAGRLCDAVFCVVYRFDGVLVHVTAHRNMNAAILAELQRHYPRALDGMTVVGRSILDRRPFQVEDARGPQAPPMSVVFAERLGYRTLLSAPMLREGLPIGAIALARREARLFTEAELELVQTFADQAVIAIENVRLFKELEEKNKALTTANAQVTEALEQRTATSDILRVIAGSPTDVQPVFEAIAATAARLCDATFSAMVRFDGGLLHLVAMNNMTPEETEAYRSLFPRLPGRHFIFGRAFLDGRPVHVDDVLTDPDYDPHTLEVLQRAAVYRTCLGIPILRDGVSIGVIGCARREVKPFTATQIELVKTFADQAVIAIENVRLFTELQARNRELTVTLAQQTATSEVLAVISGAQTDVQPVFEAIVQSARRLCDASYSSVYRLDGQLVHLVAHNHQTPRGC